MTPYRHADKPEPRPKTADDIFCDELRDHCARAMVRHFKAALNTSRAIKSLTLPEMLALAEACTSAWITKVSERMNADRSSVPAAYANMLMG